VAPRDEHLAADGRAREEGPARRRHVRAAPPRAGQEVVHVHRRRRRPRLGVPPAQHQQLRRRAALADRGELAEEREAGEGSVRGRGQRRPRAAVAGGGGRVVEHEAEGVSGAGCGVLASRAGAGERRPRLREREERVATAGAVVGRRLELRLPAARDAARRGEVLEPHAQQALPGHVLREPRDEVGHRRGFLLAKLQLVIGVVVRSGSGSDHLVS